MRKVSAVFNSPQGHWVGDGFPVRTMFSYDRLSRLLSPFLLLDYAGPAEFAPAEKPRGVGAHPHRGFETVTIVYHGSVAHRDSAGNGGVIGAGDVQWMTAGAGLLHEEMHTPEFTRTGGLLEAAQLWVNLPAAHKTTPPRYQTLSSAQIPTVALPDGAGTLRVIAGEFAGQRGPADCFTPLNVWDLHLQAGQEVLLPIPAGWNRVVALLRGQMDVGAEQPLGAADLAIFDNDGESLRLRAHSDCLALVLSGEPINEPVVGYGPFVMNTRAEVEAAFTDYQTGLFGSMS